MQIEIEHFALQTPDPDAVAEWYVAHLGFEVKRKGTSSVRAHFLADAGGRVMIEIYSNPAAPTLDYAAMHPLTLHLAFTVDDTAGTRDRLLEAGATLVDDVATSPSGDVLLMLRDPWGLALQFVKRARPML
ncbi:MAG: VOC family protein [Chthoniobacteraceae bacterium]